MQEKRIYRQIDNDYQQTEEDLHFAGESVGIDDGYQVVIDKIGGVAFFTGQLAEMVFKGSQRADIA